MSLCREHRRARQTEGETLSMGSARINDRASVDQGDRWAGSFRAAGIWSLAMFRLEQRNWLYQS